MGTTPHLMISAKDRIAALQRDINAPVVTRRSSTTIDSPGHGTAKDRIAALEREIHAPVLRRRSSSTIDCPGHGSAKDLIAALQEDIHRVESELAVYDMMVPDELDMALVRQELVKTPGQTSRFGSRVFQCCVPPPGVAYR